MPYEPKIIAYLCTWCSYTGADTAGIARLKSPANIRAIRVPCSGRVSPELILRTFDQGADGVLVLGCHIGECHYESGNHRTAKRLPALHALLNFVGLEPERLHLDWVSASEGERYSRIVTEFTESVRALGPVRWRLSQRAWPAEVHDWDNWRVEWKEESQPLVRIPDQDVQITQGIRAKAHDLLARGEVSCILGYELGPRSRTRPAFVYKPQDVERLVWNQDCTHNLTGYLQHKLKPARDKTPAKPVAVVVKPCDSKTINVLLSENRFAREQVHIIGVTCDGIRQGAGFNAALEGVLQSRCLSCTQHIPVVYDTLISAQMSDRSRDVSIRLEVQQGAGDTEDLMAAQIARLDSMTPTERMDFWLSQFDRCIRCYACRQVCPVCDCPTCLFERDDSLWVGMGTGINEKRTFHLGRAYHLAGRCIGCNECERVCPMDIPISLLNRKLAQEMQSIFGYQAGLAPIPPPLVTVLSGEEKIK